jgi:hypothetical protein
MKTISRAAFIAAGNAFWLAQAGVEVFAPQLQAYLTWRKLAFKPDLQIGCFRDSYYDSLSDRFYVVALVWLLTAPLMTAVALKLPQEWPCAVKQVWWRREAAGLSWATLLAVFALVAWPLITALRAPVPGIMAMEAGRIALIAVPALYYRATVLSAVQVSGRFT